MLMNSLYQDITLLLYQDPVLPVRGLTPLPLTWRSGETTRLAMGADDNNSLIYIFQGKAVERNKPQ